MHKFNTVIPLLHSLRMRPHTRAQTLREIYFSVSILLSKFLPTSQVHHRCRTCLLHKSVLPKAYITMVVHKAHSIPFSEPTQETIEHFKSIPWCHALFNNPDLHPITTLTRIPKLPSSQDALISSTLASSSTVQSWQTFWSPPSSTAPLGQLIAILSLADGLSGHAHTLHGGIISLILDEAMNYIGAAHLTPGMSAYTAYIKVDFKKPCFLPATVMARSWVEEKSKGRKLYIRGSVEDGQGGVHAEGESLFIEFGRQEVKL